MAKKAMLSIGERIKRAEQYILMDLYQRYKLDPAGLQHQLDTSFANLKELYAERDFDRYLERLQAIPVPTAPPTQTVVFLGPDKLRQRHENKDRQQRKHAKAQRDQAIRASMKGRAA